MGKPSVLTLASVGRALTSHEPRNKYMLQEVPLILLPRLMMCGSAHVASPKSWLLLRGHCPSHLSGGPPAPLPGPRQSSPSKHLVFVVVFCGCHDKAHQLGRLGQPRFMLF